MSVYVAKGIGFGLAWYAKRALGSCPNSLLRFKVAETVTLAAELAATALLYYVL
jgi:hypothetical protein